MKKMRIWENIARQLQEPISNEVDPLYGNTDADYRKSALKSKKEIEEELQAIGIDVEYIVTSVYPGLRRSTWVYNYKILEVKKRVWPIRISDF